MMSFVVIVAGTLHLFFAVVKYYYRAKNIFVKTIDMRICSGKVVASFNQGVPKHEDERQS
jgi:hypothetical protein